MSSNPETIPSLRIARDIIDIDSDSLAALRQAAEAATINLRLGCEGRFDVVNPDEIRKLYCFLGEAPTLDTLDEMADFLADSMDDVSDQPLDLPVLPLHSYFTKVSRGRHGKGLSANCRLLTDSRAKLAENERRFFKKAVYRFFEVSGAVALQIEHADIWTPTSERGITVAIARRSQINDMLQFFSEHSSLLPKIIQAGPAYVEDV